MRKLDELGDLGCSFDDVAKDLAPSEGLEETPPAPTAQLLERTEALARSEARLGAILESALDCIISMDHEGRVVEFNPAAERTFGRARADVLARPLADLIIPPQLRQAHRQGLAHYLATGEGPFLGRRIETTGLRADGSEFPVELAVVRIDQGGKALFTAYLRDLSDQRRLEEELRQSQKMDAIGRLAGGVAHDFNNLLTVISGYTQLLLGQLQDGTLRRKAEEIRRACERAASLTRQLLAFSRKQVLQPKPLDLNAAVTDMHKMLRRLIGEHIELVTVPGAGLARVQADPGQIEQVVINLVVNSRDAMPGGGRITIETANVDLDATYVKRRPPVKPGPYVMMAISDTGSGIDGATQARIFEPFFTSKAQGEGTGLGLAMVYGIVKQSRGYVWVYSEPGLGATFKVYLPRSDHAEPEKRVEKLTTAAESGSETILLVEDEDQIRELVRLVLEDCGYTVLDASNGTEALRVSEEHEDPIHLLLTDIVMPRMSGPVLLQRLLPIRPGMKVIVMSGYTDRIVGQHGLLDPTVAFLQKPFTLEAVARKVREVLDAVSEGSSVRATRDQQAAGGAAQSP